jgi:hypothetical protein
MPAYSCGCETNEAGEFVRVCPDAGMLVTRTQDRAAGPEQRTAAAAELRAHLESQAG